MDTIDASFAQCNWAATSAPTVGDDSADGYSIGSIWFNTTAHILYVAENVTVGAAVWRQIYPATNADTVDGYHATAFAILAGQAGGQTLYGGTAASENLILNSTSNATKGYVQIPGGNLTLGTAATTSSLGFKIHEGASGAANPISFLDGDGTTVRASIRKNSSDQVEVCAGDGTTADITVGTDGGIGLAGTSPSTSFKVFADYSATDPSSETGLQAFSLKPTFTGTETVTEHTYVSQFNAQPLIATGHVNSGRCAALYCRALRNFNGTAVDDSGTLTDLLGMNFSFGNYNLDSGETPVTTNAIGLKLLPYARSGTITNLYSIYIEALTTGGTVTNNWGIYQVDTGNNYINGTYTRFGVTTGDHIIHVNPTSATDHYAHAWTTSSCGAYKNDLGEVRETVPAYSFRDALRNIPLHSWTRKPELEDEEQINAVYPIENNPLKDEEVLLAERDYYMMKDFEYKKTLKKFTQPQFGLFG